MPTDCSADRFEFAPVEGRAVVAGFDGGTITSDAGALLLGRHRPGDRPGPAVRRLLCRPALGRAGRAQPGDPGRPARVRAGAGLRGSGRPRHPAPRPGAGRGHRQAQPPVAPTARRWPASRPSTGSSTRRPARRRATTRSATTRAAIERLFVDLFLDAHATPPEEIVLDLDATDDPLHGSQEGRFFHGYYGCYCYLPLYVFCGDHLLAAKLRRSNIDASAGAVEEVERIVAPDPRPLAAGADHPARRLRLRPRGADGLVRGQRVDYVLGLARNSAPGRRDRRRTRPGQGRGRSRPARRRAASRTSATRPSTAGAASAGWSARPSSWSTAAARRAPTRASS